MKVATKSDMLTLQAMGQLGNYLKTYPIEAISQLTERPNAYFTIQSRERDSPHFVPVAKGQELPTFVHLLVQAGQKLSNIYFRDIPHPELNRTIQGEFCKLTTGYYLKFLTDSTCNLRDALKDERVQIAEGLQAYLVVTTMLGDDSVSLLDLLSTYPDATIEFTYFSRPVGVHNSPLLIWEVRDY